MRIISSMRSIAIIIGLSAGSAGAFQPPAGCVGELTVQYEGCMLSHVWTCAADPEGHKWVALFGADGPYQIRRVDREFQWLETYYMSPVRTETMVVPALDPENLTELFATGEDLYDFTIVSEGDAVRYQGYDRLTGETVVIDGQTLLRTEYSYQALGPDGETLWSRLGNQYVSKEHRLFFFGTSRDAATPDVIADHSPREFKTPGQPGFMANTPIYGCGMMMSGLPTGGGA